MAGKTLFELGERLLGKAGSKVAASTTSHLAETAAAREARLRLEFEAEKAAMKGAEKATAGEARAMGHNPKLGDGKGFWKKHKYKTMAGAGTAAVTIANAAPAAVEEFMESAAEYVSKGVGTLLGGAEKGAEKVLCEQEGVVGFMCRNGTLVAVAVGVGVLLIVVN